MVLVYKASNDLSPQHPADDCQLTTTTSTAADDVDRATSLRVNLEELAQVRAIDRRLFWTASLEHPTSPLTRFRAYPPGVRPAAEDAAVLPRTVAPGDC